MFWALVTRLSDILAVIGFLTVMYFAIRSSIWASDRWRRHRGK